MDVVKKDNGSPLKSSLGSYVVSIVILCAGMLMSVLVFVAERAEENERIELHLEEEAEERILSVRSELDHIIDSVAGMHSLFIASIKVDRSEFSSYVQHDLMSHRSIQALEWIPRVADEKRREFEDAAIRDGLEGFRFTERDAQGNMVRAAQRDEYFPVYYLEPLEGNETAVGFDLASNKTRLESLNQSRDTGRIVATAKLILVQETAKQPGFLLFQPIYKKGLPVNTVTERRVALEGFVLGVYKVVDLINEALEDYPSVGIDLAIFDTSSPPGEGFLYHYSETEHDKSQEYTEDITEAAMGLHYSEIINIGRRNWKIIFTPAPGFMTANKTGRPFEFLVFGLLTTGGLVFVSVILIGRARKVSILVDIRTEELRQARNELEIRVQERTAELSESEERFRSINANAADAIFLIDNDGTIIYCNPAAERIFKYEPGELSGKELHKLLVPEKYHDDFKKGFSRFRDTGQGNLIGKSRDVMALRKDGTEFQAEVSISALKLKGSWHAAGVVRDITERKKAEDEIRRVAKELGQLIETANAPIFGIDMSGKVNEWNQTTERITGYTKDDVMGHALVDEFITDEYKESVKGVLDKALAGQETANYEFTLYTKAGRRVIILLNATTRRNPEGKITGVIGIGQDITVISEYQETLQQKVIQRTEELNKSLADTEQARDRIDGILKSVADGLIVTDTYNRVILMNRAAEELLGVRFSEVIDRPIDFAIKDDTLREKIKDTLSRKTVSYQFDFELPEVKTEKPRIMRARTSVILDKDGAQSGIVTIIHDVSHEREVDRMKTEFISTAAHELRTPLTTIQGFSKILITKKNLTPENREKYLSYINIEAVNLARIINDLLDIARIESGRSFILNRVPCIVGDAIKEIVPFFKDETDNHELVINLPEKPTVFNVDKDKMGQVLKNIISNAIKYSPKGGLIKITAEVIDGQYHVSVEDSGLGMTPEQVNQIFDKFYRVDATDSAIEGTGLGMTIVKHIVEAHGGEVSVESELGKGTKVTFTIPVKGDSEDKGGEA